MNETVSIFLALTATAVLGFVTFVALRNSKSKGRGAEDKRTVATPCASNGHAYRAYETGWRCVECGNHVPRIDGEVYGPAEDGLRERRRESR